MYLGVTFWAVQWYSDRWDESRCDWNDLLSAVLTVRLNNNKKGEKKKEKVTVHARLAT